MSSKVLTEEEKDEQFVEAYNKLCEKHGRSIITAPTWRFSADGNDFRLALVTKVNRMGEPK